jgi:PncC family amidohydrolase
MKCREEKMQKIKIEEKLVEALKKRKMTITTAESCTGGLIAATIVNVSGASEVFAQGYVTYANHAKRELLGVKKKTLKKHGAVSRQTAKQMAKGAARAADAEVAVSATGIAGPDGGTSEKPVGLVYIGCCCKGKTKVLPCHFSGSRQEVREQTVFAALSFALDCMGE